MKFQIKPTKLYLKQLKSLSQDAAITIKQKILLIKQNPFRYKKIQGHNLFIFRIRFKDNNKEKRLIYLVEKNKIKILFILDRNKNYKDLNKYLEKLGY